MPARLRKSQLPTGAGVGTIGGAASGHPLEGGLAGLAAGAATVGIVSLFTHNADLFIPRGTQVEMVLQRPLLLEEANLAGVSDPGTAPELVPAASQPNQSRAIVRASCARPEALAANKAKLSRAAPACQLRLPPECSPILAGQAVQRESQLASRHAIPCRPA